MRSRVPSFISRSLMGKETCQRTRSDPATWSRSGAFFFLIDQTFEDADTVMLSFEISTGNNKLGESPMIKQLSMNDIVKDRT